MRDLYQSSYRIGGHIDQETLRKITEAAIAGYCELDGMLKFTIDDVVRHIEYGDVLEFIKSEAEYGEVEELNVILRETDLSYIVCSAQYFEYPQRTQYFLDGKFIEERTEDGSREATAIQNAIHALEDGCSEEALKILETYDDFAYELPEIVLTDALAARTKVCDDALMVSER